jgi:hypothetical protein
MPVAQDSCALDKTVALQILHSEAGAIYDEEISQGLGFFLIPKIFDSSFALFV